MTPPSTLRVALFAEQGHPDGAFRSGVTRLTDNLVRRCQERDDVVLDFITYHPRAGCDETGPVRWVRVPPRVRASFHGLDVDALDVAPLPNQRLLRATVGRTYDVVLATSPGIGTQGQLLARSRGLPFAALYTTDLPRYAEALVHHGLRAVPGSALAGAWARALTWRYLAWLYGRKRTDLVLVPTEPARADFIARVDAETVVLGRGADTLVFPPVARAAGKPVRLLYVGRIDYGQKNLAVLEDLVTAVPEAVLWVVGEGDDLPLMRRRLARQEAEGRVLFTGRVDDVERLRRLYMAADVFVFPSLLDTLGQVVLEAQRAGLPVVVRDRGGPPALVRADETGFVTGDDAAFVRQTARLVADPELRLRMGRAARVHADALPTWGDVTDRLFQLLLALASDSTRLAASR